MNEKTVLNSLYGMATARPVPPDYDTEILNGEIQDLKLENDLLKILNGEIQDLKLENDLLKRRDDIMVTFIRSVTCIGIFCDKCDFHDDSRHCCMFDHGSMSEEVSDLYMIFSDKAEDILERLDNL